MRFDVYDPAFLTRLKILQTRRQNQVQYLRRLETDEGAGILFIQNSLGQIRSAQPCHHTLLSLRQLVYGRGTLIERLKRFSRSTNLPEIAGLEPFFWLNPKRYPPPSDELIQLIEDTAVETFVKKARQLLLDSKLEDFLELQAAVMKGGGEGIEWLIEQINSVRVTHIGDVEVLAELFRELDEISRREILSKLRCHPYVRAVLVRKIVRPVVLDGSNIARLRGKLSDIDFVLERLASFEEFYYPYYLVFDRNIRYIFNEDSEWFYAERTYFHSPADELILSIALEKNAIVVSNDRFEEWNSKIDRIDLGRFFQ
ncbi:hypothetical protein [Thermotoga caldifontis]|uniref:hypothetical protein n=1 Tax=Thermotoga caldifontis TaxID=1508419 RepID=UPI00059798A9|nr:hypothetical protein [Thermotoga caldifontis]